MTEFFASTSVRDALVATAIVGALSASIGYFVVLRALSFAGHAVADVGLTGGAGALVVGIAPLDGLLAFSVSSALIVGALGARARERDIATGLVLASALGLGALFLHLQTASASAQSALLFGSIFEVEPTTLHAVALVGAVALAALAAIARPLLFASVAPDAARISGVPVRTLGFAFLALMAVAVAVTAQIVGVLISTALLIGPAATAFALARRPSVAIGTAIGLAIAESWLAIALAYASYGWSGGRGLPASSFVTALALGAYLAARRIGGA